jgi:hypothetical protein
MERLNILSGLPKEAQIMYQRIPDELRCELDVMPPDKMIRVVEALNKFHHAMEAEVYELALRLIQAGHSSHSSLICAVK